MAHPEISIVIPLYNKEQYVERAIHSVLSQTYRDFELIVVNDGSTDRGPEIVSTIKDPRILIINQVNTGVSSARNRGISESKSALIAFLDADDEWRSDFLECIFNLYRNYPHCNIFAANYSYRRANGYLRKTIIRGLPDNFEEGEIGDYFAIAAKSDPPLCASAVAVSKKAITSIGGFPLGVTAGEDLITWTRLALKYRIAYDKEPKAYFWEPYDPQSRPGRVPQDPDIVGQELVKLINLADENRNSLKCYASLWHRMRASVFLRIGENKKARHDLQQSISLSGMNIKLFLYITLTYFPAFLSNTLLRLTISVNQFYTNIFFHKP